MTSNRNLELVKLAEKIVGSKDEVAKMTMAEINALLATKGISSQQGPVQGQGPTYNLSEAETPSDPRSEQQQEIERLFLRAKKSLKHVEKKAIPDRKNADFSEDEHRFFAQLLPTDDDGQSPAAILGELLEKIDQYVNWANRRDAAEAPLMMTVKGRPELEAYEAYLNKTKASRGAAVKRFLQVADWAKEMRAKVY